MIITILISVIITIVIYGAIALTLIASQSPPPTEADDPAAGGSIGFSEAIDVDYSGLPTLQHTPARDGAPMAYREYAGSSERLIVLVHGSAWHGMQFHEMASAFVSQGLGTVIVPDLRGHGEAPDRRGDIDYIGQLEDDLADLINAMTATRSFDRVVVGGHSSGGGLAVRFAGGKHGHLADEFVLMAPFLKHDAPTTKPNSGGWASAAVRRIAGLSMLNNVGITALNHLPVISFDMPREVLDGPYGYTATTTYSYRLNTSFAPRMNVKRDLQALQQPFLLIAGTDDEAFHAHEYEPFMSAQTLSGTYVLLDGMSHIGVTTDAEAIAAIGEWIGRP